MTSKQTAFYSILGMLTIEPMSGYDIKKHMEESTANFWSESYGQIYPTLRKLLEKNYVSCTEENTDSKKPKKIYKITNAGKKFLQTWLEEPPQKSPQRNELLLKLFFGVNIKKSVCKKHISKELTSAKDYLKQMEKAYKTIKAEHKEHPHQLYWLITVSSALHHLKAHIDWCQETLKLLGEKNV